VIAHTILASTALHVSLQRVTSSLLRMCGLDLALERLTFRH
jgi:hypothetical protein